MTFCKVAPDDGPIIRQIGALVGENLELLDRELMNVGFVALTSTSALSISFIMVNKSLIVSCQVQYDFTKEIS